MLLRTSISKTKKLFQKTIGSLKSVFYGESYERLPKFPSLPCNLSHSQELKQSKRNHEIQSSNLEYRSRREEEEEETNGKKVEHGGGKYEEVVIPKNVKVEKIFRVAKMLKELEMLDKSNGGEHAMDFELILCYYSCLTYPVFADMVDRSLIDLHSELFSGSQIETLYVGNY